MERKKRVELDAALEDFESLLIRDDVRAQEKTILVKAYSECKTIWTSVFPKFNAQKKAFSQLNFAPLSPFRTKTNFTGSVKRISEQGAT